MECPLYNRACDEKHIAMKKPKKYGSKYYNYKAFFSLLLLALLDTEYRFLCVDFWSSRSSLDAQIFKQSNMRNKIKDGSLQLPPPKSLGGGPDLHYILGG